MNRALTATIAVVVVVAILVGATQMHTHASAPSAAPAPAAVSAALTGSPGPLAALHAQADLLLPASPAVVAGRLHGLHGYPVVLNKWASWCGPCRAEFPYFQRAAVSLGRQVAFVGLNSGDVASDAQTFLRQFPLSYPSYEDPHEAVARSLNAALNYPQTLFYDRTGRLAYQHQGFYTTQASLETDIRRYALGA